MKAQADCRRREKKSVKCQQQPKDKKMQLSAINAQNRKGFCPGTSRDRGVCPGTFTPVLVPGQIDTGTRKMSLSRDKGTTGQAQNLATGRDGTGF